MKSIHSVWIWLTDSRNITGHKENYYSPEVIVSISFFNISEANLR